MKDDIILKIKVITGASTNNIEGLRNDEILVRVTAIPENGAANKAVIKLFAKKIGVAKSTIKIISGISSQHKKIHLQSLDKDLLYRKLKISFPK